MGECWYKLPGGNLFPHAGSWQCASGELMLEGIFRCHPVLPPPFGSVYSTGVIPEKCSSDLFLQCWALHGAPGSQGFTSFACRTFSLLHNLGLPCCSLVLTEHMGDGLLLFSLLQLLHIGRLSLFILPKPKQAN